MSHATTTTLTLDGNTFMLTNGTDDTLYIRRDDRDQLTPDWMGDVAMFSQINALMLGGEGAEETVTVEHEGETWEEDVLAVRVGRVTAITGVWVSTPAEAFEQLTKIEAEEPTV